MKGSVEGQSTVMALEVPDKLHQLHTAQLKYNVFTETYKL
jgi:hypothetical protein